MMFWSCDTTGAAINTMCYYYQHHMMPMVSYMALQHSSGQDSQNKVKHDCFGHMTPQMPPSALHNTTVGVMLCHW